MVGQKLIAIDIGNRTTKIIYGSSNKKSIVINEYDIIDTPEDCIKDGMIINPDKLAVSIGEVLKKNKIRSGDLVFNVTGTGVITREIQLPDSTEQELQQILEFEAQQYFPVDLSNYTFDFKVLEKVKTDEINQCRILIVAAPNKQLESFINLSRLLKRNLHNIDIPANCLLKLQGFQEHTVTGKNEDYAVVDIGRYTSLICIFRDNTLKFSRILLNGSSEIDNHIASNFNIEYKQAEDVKIRSAKQEKEYLKSSGSNIQLDLQFDQEKLNEVIETALGNIASDISRFIEFYNSRETKNQVQKIYVCGGGSKLNRLCENLSNIFNMPVLQYPIKLNIVYKGKKDKKTFEEDYIQLLNVIGSLLN